MAGPCRRLVAGWLVAGAGAALGAQDPPAVFRATADVVAVYATVRDAQGRLATGLSKDDFEVRENGTAREIAAFSNEIQPITLAMILDRSGSLAAKSREVTAAAMGFFAALRPGDRVSLGSLSWDCVPLTGDLERLRRAAAGRMPVDPGSPIWQSVDRAFFAHAAEPGRRAILVFSDGADGGTQFMTPPELRARSSGCTPADGATGASMREVATRAERNGVLVYAVGVEAFGRRRMDGDLRTLARNTGGELFRLKDDEPMTPLFERIAEELHHQYLLGFVPTTPAGQSGKIEVRVKRSGFTVRARRSFLVAPGTTSSAGSTRAVAGPLSDDEVAAAVKEGLAGRSLRSTCSAESTAPAGGFLEVTLEGPVARVMRAAREARQRRAAFGVADVPDRLRQPVVQVSAVGRLSPIVDPPPGPVSPGNPPIPSATVRAPFGTAIQIRSLGEVPVVLRPIVTGSIRMTAGPYEVEFDLNAFRALGDAVEVIVGSFAGEARCRLSRRALDMVK